MDIYNEEYKRSKRDYVYVVTLFPHSIIKTSVSKTIHDKEKSEEGYKIKKLLESHSLGKEDNGGFQEKVLDTSHENSRDTSRGTSLETSREGKRKRELITVSSSDSDSEEENHREEVSGNKKKKRDLVGLELVKQVQMITEAIKAGFASQSQSLSSQPSPQKKKKKEKTSPKKKQKTKKKGKWSSYFEDSDDEDDFVNGSKKDKKKNEGGFREFEGQKFTWPPKTKEGKVTFYFHSFNAICSNLFLLTL